MSSDAATRRRRADVELVRRGLVASREEAQAAIAADLVVVDGAPLTRPATQVLPSQSLRVLAPPRRFASRGGEKLDHALERFGVDVRGAHCLDAGASTGGFTDVLLARGASGVVACDVGYGQLAPRLRDDARVTVLERTNVRELTADRLPFRPDVVVADLSFVPLRLVLPTLRELAMPDARFVLLVKPQFEVGRARLGRGGVVRDADAWRTAVEGVVAAARELGLGTRDVTASPLRGPAGNVEFLVDLAAGEGAADLPRRIDAAIAEAPGVAAVPADGLAGR